MSNESEVRYEIMTATFVVSREGVLALSTDSDTVLDIVEKAKAANIEVKTVSVTSNRQRFERIGRVGLTGILPSEALKDPLTYRNKLIREWQDAKDSVPRKIKVDENIVWNRVSAKHKLSFTFDDFNTSMLDLHELRYDNLR